MIRLVFESLTVNVDVLVKSFTPELFAADEAIEMAKRGIPFRDAYKQIGMNIDKLAARDPQENILAKTHLGAPGNLRLNELRESLAQQLDCVKRSEERLNLVKHTLLEA